jgi:murein DD-endopeptidase MepM/ murein hydrolase activator NlpD
MEMEYVLEERPSETRHRLINGTLNSPTLDAELRTMGLSSNIIGVTSNVLASRVAFRTDARIGDEFSLLLKEVFFSDTTEDSEVIERTLDERTQILFLSYSGVRAGTHRGYRFFAAPNSSYNAHYTEDGRAMIFAGLRYPLDRIHITSPFGMRRHPVTGVRTMHNGVDYRARVGTPVFAVAEGRVVKSSQDNLNGNYVAIRHVDGTTSYYLHLSRRNVAVGANVRARQQIGLSGATGLVTGPHLCFRIRDARGQWINPANKRMIATPQLTGEKLEDLGVQITEIREILKSKKGEEQM